MTNINPGFLSPEVRATCDPGETAIGGGGTPSTPDLVMHESWPVSNAAEWLVQFRNVGTSTATTPQIVAFAICASD